MKKHAFHILAVALIVLINSCSTIQDTTISAVNDAIGAVKLVNNSTTQDSSKSDSATVSTKASVTYNDDIFRYTIDTNFEKRKYLTYDNVEILIAMNSEDGQYSFKYDLDCEGDGEFEFKDLTENHKCIYQKDSGKHQIWLRGEIPAMFLCVRKRSDTKCSPNLPPKEFKHRGCYLPLEGDHSYDAIVSIDSWGNVSWKSMHEFARSCMNLQKIPEDSPDLSQVRDMSLMFAETRIDQPIEHWDVSNVTTMSGMFHFSRFDQPLEKWNVSNVTDMSSMFANTNFNKPLEKKNLRLLSCFICSNCSLSQF